MDTIRINSKGVAVETLQKMLPELGFPVTVTGTFDETTRQAVIGFQRKYGLDADGIVGYRSWETLFFANRGDGKKLTDDDFRLAARLLDVEVAALKAVKEVESGRYGGFLASHPFRGTHFLEPVEKTRYRPRKAQGRQRGYFVPEMGQVALQKR